MNRQAGRTPNDDRRAPGEDAAAFRARFEQLKQSLRLEAMWDRRHPMYARMFYVPILGGHQLRSRLFEMRAGEPGG
jgi:hypothetical protein